MTLSRSIMLRLMHREVHQVPDQPNQPGHRRSPSLRRVGPRHHGHGRTLSHHPHRKHPLLTPTRKRRRGSPPALRLLHPNPEPSRQGPLLFPPVSVRPRTAFSRERNTTHFVDRRGTDRTRRRALGSIIGTNGRTYQRRDLRSPASRPIQT